jgi:hypothetical protein
LRFEKAKKCQGEWGKLWKKSDHSSYVQEEALSGTCLPNSPRFMLSFLESLWSLSTLWCGTNCLQSCTSNPCRGTDSHLIRSSHQRW